MGFLGQVLRRDLFWDGAGERILTIVNLVQSGSVGCAYSLNRLASHLSLKATGQLVPLVVGRPLMEWGREEVESVAMSG